MLYLLSLDDEPDVVSEDDPGEPAGGVRSGGGGIVDGDADGDVTSGRSLVRLDGDWLQALANVATSARTQNAPSNLFTGVPPPGAEPAVWGSKRGATGHRLTPLLAFSMTGASDRALCWIRPMDRRRHIAPRTKETSG